MKEDGVGGNSQRSYYPADYASYDDGIDVLSADDSKLIETYRERLARKERERKAAADGRAVEDIPTRTPRRIRKLANGRIMDEAFFTEFRRLYSSPMSVKAIVRHFGMSNNMPYKLAKECGLTVRQHPKISKKRTGETIAWHLQIDAKLLAKMDAHIGMRYRSRQAYITTLIKRDLGQ